MDSCIALPDLSELFALLDAPAVCAEPEGSSPSFLAHLSSKGHLTLVSQETQLDTQALRARNRARRKVRQSAVQMAHQAADSRPCPPHPGCSPRLAQAHTALLAGAQSLADGLRAAEKHRHLLLESNSLLQAATLEALRGRVSYAECTPDCSTLR